MEQSLEDFVIEVQQMLEDRGLTSSALSKSQLDLGFKLNMEPEQMINSVLFELVQGA